MSYPVAYGNVALYVPPAYFSPGWWPAQRLSCPAMRVGATTNGVLPWGAACTSTLRRPTLSVARNRMYRVSLPGPMLTDPAGGRQPKSPVYAECHGGTRPFDLSPHEADFVEVGRNPNGGVVLALPAGHWAVGSRGRFKNLRSPQAPITDCAPRNAHSGIRSGPSRSSRAREGPSHGERLRFGPAISVTRTTPSLQGRSMA